MLESVTDRRQNGKTIAAYISVSIFVIIIVGSEIQQILQRTRK